MPQSVRLLLHGELHRHVPVVRADVLNDALTLVANHQHQFAHPSLQNAVEDVPQDGLIGNGEQRLRHNVRVRTQARAETSNGKRSHAPA
jgi:hypothetical protein